MCAKCGCELPKEAPKDRNTRVEKREATGAFTFEDPAATADENSVEGGEPFDDHDSGDNVTAVDLKEGLTQEEAPRPAEAQRISVEKVRRNLEASAKRTGRR